jgi:hypothetical protein
VPEPLPEPDPEPLPEPEPLVPVPEPEVPVLEPEPEVPLRVLLLPVPVLLEPLVLEGSVLLAPVPLVLPLPVPLVLPEPVALVPLVLPVPEPVVPVFPLAPEPVPLCVPEELPLVPEPVVPVPPWEPEPVVLLPEVPLPPCEPEVPLVLPEPLPPWEPEPPWLGVAAVAKVKLNTATAKSPFAIIDFTVLTCLFMIVAGCLVENYKKEKKCDDSCRPPGQFANCLYLPTPSGVTMTLAFNAIRVYILQSRRVSRLILQMRQAQQGSRLLSRASNLAEKIFTPNFSLVRFRSLCTGENGHATGKYILNL